MTLGKQIRDHRKFLGLSQKTLANVLNVNPKTLSLWERDISSPDIIKTIEILSVLHGGKWEFDYGSHHIVTIDIKDKIVEDIVDRIKSDFRGDKDD